MSCLQHESQEASLPADEWKDIAFCQGEVVLHAVFHPENCLKKDDGSYEMKDSALRFREFANLGTGEKNGISFFRTDLPHGRQIWRRITSLAERKPSGRKSTLATYCQIETLNGYICSFNEELQIEFEFITDANINNKTHVLLCTKQEVTCILDQNSRVKGFLLSDGKALGEAHILMLRRRIVSRLSPLSALSDLIDTIIFDSCDGCCSQGCPPIPIDA